MSNRTSDGEEVVGVAFVYVIVKYLKGVPYIY